jgi:hypothetical protein
MTVTVQKKFFNVGRLVIVTFIKGKVLDKIRFSFPWIVLIGRHLRRSQRILDPVTIHFQMACVIHKVFVRLNEKCVFIDPVFFDQRVIVAAVIGFDFVGNDIAGSIGTAVGQMKIPFWIFCFRIRP